MSSHSFYFTFTVSCPVMNGVQSHMPMHQSFPANIADHINLAYISDHHLLQMAIPCILYTAVCRCGTSGKQKPRKHFYFGVSWPPHIVCLFACYKWPCYTFYSLTFCIPLQQVWISLATILFHTASALTCSFPSWWHSNVLLVIWSILAKHALVSICEYCVSFLQ